MNKENLLMWGALGLVAFMIFRKREILTPGQNRALYRPAFVAATKKYNLPPGLVERVAQQESSFRSDVIHGPPNRANAQGIMQIVKRWHPESRPSDPYHSIDYGAKYLKQLFGMFKGATETRWKHALMAYNWGPGNVKKLLAGEPLTVPRETRNYEQQILADVRVA